MFSFSIVLPCLDEVQVIEAVIEQARLVASELAESYEIVVVDDGSRDGTAALVGELAARYAEVRLLRNATNRGYGSALARGLRAARMPWVFYTDADGQFDLSDLRRAVSILPEHGIVCGYRADRQDGWLRGVNGRGWTWLTNSLFSLGVHDVNCSFKIFPRTFFDRIEMRSKGAFIDAEILSQARQIGMSIVQLPVRHRPRSGGEPTGGRLRVIGRAWVELVAFVVGGRGRLADVLRTDAAHSPEA